MKTKNDAHGWFMAHSGSTREGVRLTIRPEYGNKAYLGEYRWGNDHGINTRWQIEKFPYESQHFHGFDTKEDVQRVVDEGFAYCIQVKNFLQNKS